MSTKHRELLMELITKRFEKVLNEDALDTLQILMELYCDAKALDQITIENRPTVPAVPAAQPKPKAAPKPPKKPKSGGVRHRQACRCDPVCRRKAAPGECDRAGGQAADLPADPRRVCAGRRNLSGSCMPGGGRRSRPERSARDDERAEVPDRPLARGGRSDHCGGILMEGI